MVRKTENTVKKKVIFDNAFYFLLKLILIVSTIFTIVIFFK